MILVKTGGLIRSSTSNDCDKIYVHVAGLFPVDKRGPSDKSDPSVHTGAEPSHCRIQNGQYRRSAAGSAFCSKPVTGPSAD